VKAAVAELDKLGVDSVRVIRLGQEIDVLRSTHDLV